MVCVNKYTRWHLFIFSLLSIWFLVFTPISFIHKFLAAAICLGVLLHMTEIHFAFNQWGETVLFVAVNIYLTFAIFGYDLFLVNSLATGRLARLLYFGFGFIWTGYILQSVLDVFNRLSESANHLCMPSSGSYWKKWLILLLIMFASFMIWHLAYNPIVMSPDSWNNINGWREGKYFMSRSPVYSFLITLICRFAPTKPEVQWVAFVQIVAFSSLLSTVLMYFHKKWVRFRYILPLAIFLPMIPSFGLHAIVIWSDLACGASILWLTYVLIRVLDEVIISDSTDKKQEISFCIQLCISMILIYFTRTNSFLVFLVMAPSLALLFFLKKKWKLFATIGISVVMVLLIRYPGYGALNAQSGTMDTYGKYYAGLHDIQATYYDGGKLSNQTLSLLKNYIKKLDDPEITFLRDWALVGVYEYMDLSGLTLKEFIGIYTDSFIRNPSKMIKSMLFRVRAYWVIDPKGKIGCVNYTFISVPGDGYRTEAPIIGVYRQHNILTDIMNKYIAEMIKPIPATFVWRYGIWTSLMIISIMMLLLKRRYIWLLVYLPVFVYLSSLVLACACTDYRFGLSIFFVGMFLPAFFVLSDASVNNETAKGGMCNVDQ